MTPAPDHELAAPPEPPSAFAARLQQARAARTVLDGARDRPTLALAEAYAVQDALTTLYVSQGREVIGFKLGYTSVAMRRQMGVDAPNYGPLYADMVQPSGGSAVGFIQPRVEPEVAVVLRADLAGEHLTLHEIADAVGEVRAALEIVDSIWADYRFTAAQNTADGSSAAGVVLGDVLPIDPRACHQVTVDLTVDGTTVGTATGSAASGHPLLGLRWLCDQLAARGGGLSAGQLVITGGLTSAVPLDPGSEIAATFSGRTRVSVRREDAVPPPA